MKRHMLILTAVFLMATGCHAPMRTGKICMVPFITAGFSTSNPVDIKQDTVDAIRDQLPKWFKRRIEEESLIKFVDDCSQADYKITGQVTRVDTAMQGGSYVNPFFGNRTNFSQRSFGVGISCVAQNIHTLETISTFEEFKHGKNLDESLEDLAHYFLHTIDREKPAK